MNTMIIYPQPISQYVPTRNHFKSKLLVQVYFFFIKKKTKQKYIVFRFTKNVRWSFIAGTQK